MNKLISIFMSALIIISIPLTINAYADEHDVNTEPDSEIVEQTNAEADEPAHNWDNSIPDTPDIIDESPVDVPNLYEAVTEYIPVEDIELSDFNEEMYVKDTQDLSATIFPANASEQTVRYSSSNTSVAKVSSIGKITAVGKGSCRIYISCDNMTVYYDLRVKVKTESINVKSKYIVIKPNEQFQLEANVQPAEASQELSFKSNDDSVAVVGPDGVITAKSVGSTSVIVSNEDTTILVNIIVNEDGNGTTVQNKPDTDTSGKKDITDELTKQIKESIDNIVKVNGISKISSSALKELYGTDKTLTVMFDDYDLSIRGQDIFNANNEINTILDLSETSDGLLINMTDENKLPGTITVSLKNDSNTYKYFYLMNNSKDYQMLNTLSNNTIKISSVGEYLLTEKNMNKFKINIVWVLGAAGVILLMSLIYIFTKKKYWFW
ncbi:MAG TPA: Ig-like domain-containing protein [Ruminococcus sp.]|nr:Ig-like domain-containing protein [Ruminococcus sp.]